MKIQEIIDSLITIKEYYTPERNFSQYEEDYEPLTEIENAALEMAIEILESLKGKLDIPLKHGTGGDDMNDDLISRQAAIDELKEHRALYCDNTPDTFSKLSYAEKSRVDELDTAIATLVNLPTAQTEQKTGRWEMKPDTYGFFDEVPVCSECGCTTEMRKTYSFCPHCGAKMEGE